MNETRSQAVCGDSWSALAALADQADAEPTWPEASWQKLQASGALAWAVPAAHGGLGLSQRQLLEGDEQLSRACLTTCFILSQRDAAIQRIAASGNEALCRELLPPLARGERFTTVGIAQITTSRQHTGPALRARLEADRVILDGVMPWVTGASKADPIVTGAILEDGRQVLLALPAALPGIEVAPALDLMALQGSCTAAVHCRAVRVERRWVLRGPAEKVLSGDATGGLTTSCLALGLAGAALAYLRNEGAHRPELQTWTGRLEARRQQLWGNLLALAETSASPEAAQALRAAANACVLRATQAALTAAKGTGFVRPHPAQRWARQALFFLVWSCPRPAAEAMLERLACEWQ